MKTLIKAIRIINALEIRWHSRYDLSFDYLVKLFKLVHSEYEWSLKHGRIIEHLIDKVESIEKGYAESRKRENSALNHVYEGLRYEQEKVKRYEKEVIHLKDIIQEKNMVIDKLLKPTKETEGARE